MDVHGCPACPHPAIGPAIQGSPDVNVNRRPAIRVDDPGIHAACCGPNTWTATVGSATVFINGKGAHRMGDQNRHCGGMGQLIEGSPNVMVGESSSAGGGGGGGGGGSGGSSSGGGGSGDRTGSSVAAVSSASTAPPAKTFVAVTLVDQDGRPVASTRFRVEASDGTMHEGQTDATGAARIEDVASGDCQISFPEIHRKVDKR